MWKFVKSNKNVCVAVINKRQMLGLKSSLIYQQEARKNIIFAIYRNVFKNPNVVINALLFLI